MSVRAWQPPQGYYWKVVVDPTRTGDEPGMFYGAHFRWTDIVPPGWDDECRKIPCPWPSGTVFENVKTGERVTIKKGKVLRLEQNCPVSVVNRWAAISSD
jgi:hypothetical protein